MGMGEKVLVLNLVLVLVLPHLLDSLVLTAELSAT